MHSPKAVAKLLIFVFLLSILSGCWDRKELEEQAFVLSIAVDKGTLGKYLWTFRLAIPRKLAGALGQGGGGKGEETSSLVSVESDTIYGALNLMNTFIDRRANLMHARVIVVGEEVAKSDPIPLRTLIRYREIRHNLFVTVAKGTAKGILLANKPKLEINPSKFYETLILNSSFTGLSNKTQLHDFIRAAKSLSTSATTDIIGKTGGLKQRAKANPLDTAPYLPGQIPREGDTGIEVIGTAVFRKGKMVGQLNGSETRALNMLTGKFRRAFISFPDPRVPNKSVALDLRSGSPPIIKVRLRDGKPIIDIKLSLEADILAIQSEVDYTKLNLMSELEITAEKYSTESIRRVISKSQKMKADIFGFGNKARHLVSTWDQWEELGWPELYPQAECNVSVNLAIRRIGLQFEPAKLQR